MGDAAVPGGAWQARRAARRPRVTTASLRGYAGVRHRHNDIRTWRAGVRGETRFALLLSCILLLRHTAAPADARSRAGVRIADKRLLPHRVSLRIAPSGLAWAGQNRRFGGAFYGTFGGLATASPVSALDCFTVPPSLRAGCGRRALLNGRSGATTATWRWQASKRFCWDGVNAATCHQCHNQRATYVTVIPTSTHRASYAELILIAITIVAYHTRHILA